MTNLGSNISRTAFALAALALAAFATPVQAALEIDLNKGVVQPIPIAISDFLGANPRDQQTAAQVAGVVRGDLERSGLFLPLDPKSYFEKITNFGAFPRFGDWRVINAQGLVTGQASQLADGQLQVDFRLWDIFAERQMIMPFDVGERARLVKDHPRRAQLVRHQPFYIRRPTTATQVTGDDDIQQPAVI